MRKGTTSTGKKGQTGAPKSSQSSEEDKEYFDVKAAVKKGNFYLLHANLTRVEL